MPASLYKLVFQDPDCKKLAPSKLEIGTYTTDTVRLVGSSMFYLVHPDTKCLQEVTFYVTSNNGSVLLSWCDHTCTLAWYNLTLDWTLFLLEPALLPVVLTTPKKTKSQISVHISRKESMKCLQCPTTKVWYPSLLQARNRFLLINQMSLMVLDAFLVPHDHI